MTSAPGPEPPPLFAASWMPRTRRRDRLRDAVRGLSSAAGGTAEGAGALVPGGADLHRRDVHDQGWRPARVRRTWTRARGAGHEPTRRFASGRQRQLGLRCCGRFLSRCNQEPFKALPVYRSRRSYGRSFEEHSRSTAPPGYLRPSMGPWPRTISSESGSIPLHIGF